MLGQVISLFDPIVDRRRQIQDHNDLTTSIEAAKCLAMYRVYSRNEWCCPAWTQRAPFQKPEQCHVVALVLPRDVQHSIYAESRPSHDDVAMHSENTSSRFAERIFLMKDYEISEFKQQSKGRSCCNPESALFLLSSVAQQ